MKKLIATLAVMFIAGSAYAQAGTAVKEAGKATVETAKEATENVRRRPATSPTRQCTR